MLNLSTNTAELSWSGDRSVSQRLFSKLSCLFFGHKVSNVGFAATHCAKHCSCGTRFLERREETRVSHTVSCFLFGHRYIRMAQRAGHNEYVCRQCGHPLLFVAGRDPYSSQTTFKKKV